MGVTIKDDRRRWDILGRTINASGRLTVEVGVRDDGRPRSGGGPTNAELVTIHEFGVDTENVKIPGRSFIRSTLDKNLAAYRRLGRELAGRAVLGQIKLTQALSLLGLQVEKDIRARIRAGIPPPLADSTIARKGSTIPLIDTSQMIRSITHKVVSRVPA